MHAAFVQFLHWLLVTNPKIQQVHAGVNASLSNDRYIFGPFVTPSSQMCSAKRYQVQYCATGVIVCTGLQSASETVITIFKLVHRAHGIYRYGSMQQSYAHLENSVQLQQLLMQQ
jgi:hypothetical protein